MGGFQAMTQDALTVLNDVPFSIPPCFALLGRAFVTLEGIALQGDPDYAIIQAAYPFVSRKLLSSTGPRRGARCRRRSTRARAATTALAARPQPAAARVAASLPP